MSKEVFGPAIYLLVTGVFFFLGWRYLDKFNDRL